MSSNARAADAAYLRRREHERRRQRTHAPVGGLLLGAGAASLINARQLDCHCDYCGYTVCSCPPERGKRMASELASTYEALGYTDVKALATVDPVRYDVGAPFAVGMTVLMVDRYAKYIVVGRRK